jgi:hypothetical protein
LIIWLSLVVLAVRLMKVLAVVQAVIVLLFRVKLLVVAVQQNQRCRLHLV